MLQYALIVLLCLVRGGHSDVMSSGAADRNLQQSSDSDSKWVFPLVGPRYSYDQWKQRCGAPDLQWLVDYVEWHRQNRNVPNVKILKYYCPIKNSRSGQGTCQGLGDRVRGILFLLRVAARCKRVFVIEQYHPAPMEQLLAPSGIIDWRPTGLNVTHGDWKYKDPWWALIGREENGYHTLPEQVLAVETNNNAETVMKLHPNVTLFSNATHCMYNALFMAAPRTLEVVQRHYKTLGLDPRRAFTAVHFRLGGSVGEESPINSMNHALPNLMTAIKCVRALAAKHGLAGEQAAHKLVVLTDHARLRKFLADGFFTDVVAAPIVPYHFDMANRGLDGIFNTMADLTVLAHASCLIIGRSGFGIMAQWWSYTPCFAREDECSSLLPKERRALAGGAATAGTAATTVGILPDKGSMALNSSAAHATPETAAAVAGVSSEEISPLLASAFAGFGSWLRGQMPEADYSSSQPGLGTADEPEVGELYGMTAGQQAALQDWLAAQLAPPVAPAA